MILRRQKMKKISRTLISFLICGAILFGMTTMALADNEVLRLTVAADTPSDARIEELVREAGFKIEKL